MIQIDKRWSINSGKDWLYCQYIVFHQQGSNVKVKSRFQANSESQPLEKKKKEEVSH